MKVYVVVRLGQKFETRLLAGSFERFCLEMAVEWRCWVLGRVVFRACPREGGDPYMDAPGLQEQSFHDDDDTRSRLQPYIRSLLQPSIWLLTHDEIR